MLPTQYEKQLSKLSDAEKIAILDRCIKRHADMSGKRKLPRQFIRYKDDCDITAELKQLAQFKTAPGKTAIDFVLTGKDLHAAMIDVYLFACKLRNIMNLPSYKNRMEGNCSNKTKQATNKRDRFIEQLIISVVEITAGIDVRLMYQNNNDDDFSLSKHAGTFSKNADLLVKAINRRSREILEPVKEPLNALQPQPITQVVKKDERKKVAALITNFNGTLNHKVDNSKLVSNAKTAFAPTVIDCPRVKLTIR